MNDPWRNPAVAVELTMRERHALMSVEDWAEQIDRLLSQDSGSDG